MRIKLSLLALVTVLATLALAPSANAAFLNVFVTPTLVSVCRTDATGINYRVEFKAKITRSGIDKPKSVRVGYKVVDASTAGVAASGVTNLTRRNKYKSKSKVIPAQAGQTLNHAFNLSYKADGRKRKAKSTSTITIPSAEQMDAENAANPTAPPFPAC